MRFSRAQHDAMPWPDLISTNVVNSIDDAKCRAFEARAKPLHIHVYYGLMAFCISVSMTENRLISATISPVGMPSFAQPKIVLMSSRNEDSL